jgi:hypothetical protein
MRSCQAEGTNYDIQKNSQDVLKVDFHFDLVFEFLRMEDPNKKLGTPYGIKFERFEKSLILRNEHNLKALIVWRDILGSKLNQRGFHEIFKPIKKIGKGNFATVYLVIKHEDGKKYAVKAFSKEAAYSE